MKYKYDIRTGVKKIKTKTAIIGSAIVLGVSGLGMAVVVPTISNAAGPASCDAGHGAPGGFGPGSPNYNSGPLGDNGVGATFGASSSNFGQEQGVNTGQQNSGASAACNHTP